MKVNPVLNQALRGMSRAQLRSLNRAKRLNRSGKKASIPKNLWNHFDHIRKRVRVGLLIPLFPPLFTLFVCICIAAIRQVWLDSVVLFVGLVLTAIFAVVLYLIGGRELDFSVAGSIYLTHRNRKVEPNKKHHNQLFRLGAIYWLINVLIPVFVAVVPVWNAMGLFYLALLAFAGRLIAGYLAGKEFDWAILWRALGYLVLMAIWGIFYSSAPDGGWQQSLLLILAVLAGLYFGIIMIGKLWRNLLGKSSGHDDHGKSGGKGQPHPHHGVAWGKIFAFVILPLAFIIGSLWIAHDEGVKQYGEDNVSWTAGMKHMMEQAGVGMLTVWHRMTGTAYHPPQIGQTQTASNNALTASLPEPPAPVPGTDGCEQRANWHRIARFEATAGQEEIWHSVEFTGDGWQEIAQPGKLVRLCVEASDQTGAAELASLKILIGANSQSQAWPLLPDNSNSYVRSVQLTVPQGLQPLQTAAGEQGLFIRVRSSLDTGLESPLNVYVWSEGDDATE